MGKEDKTINKNMLRVLGAIQRVDDAVTKAIFPVEQWLLARRGIEAYRVETSQDRRQLIARIEPIIKNASQILVAEGDLSEGLLSERVDDDDKVRVRITQTPIGAAPLEVKQQWVGTEFYAYKAYSSAGEADLLTHQPVPERPGPVYIARRNEATAALAKKSAEAASWFDHNVPKDIKAFSFGADEVKVLPNNEPPTQRSI